MFEIPANQMTPCFPSKSPNNDSDFARTCPAASPDLCHTPVCR